jgi:peptide deformylase
MTILDIIIHPNPILRQPTISVTQFGNRVSQLVNDMYQTKDHANGIGLAAPQVGLLDALFVIGYESHRKAYINPEITWKNKTLSPYDEGCLSIPNTIVTINRPKSITIKAQDIAGHWFEETLEGLLATAFQHELDHLNGILILDHGTPKPIPDPISEPVSEE